MSNQRLMKAKEKAGDGYAKTNAIGGGRSTITPRGGLELIRIRGHLTLWGGGIHHAEIKTAVRAGVPAPDG